MVNTEFKSDGYKKVGGYSGFSSDHINLSPFTKKLEGSRYLI